MWLQAGLLVSYPLVLLLLPLPHYSFIPPVPLLPTPTDDIVVTATVVVDFGNFIDV